MIFDDIKMDDVAFNRDTISNWTDNEEKQLKQLQGKEYDNYRNELIIKQMHIYDSLVVFEEEGKYGLKSKGFNHIVAQPQYSSIKSCWSKFFIVEQDGKYGLLSTGYFDSEIAYPIICDSIVTSHIDLLIIEVNGKFGLLKMEGRSVRIILKPIYDEIAKHGKEEFIVIKKDGKLGFYHHGIIINPQFDDIYVPEVFGWIKVKKNEEWGYIGVGKEFTKNVNEAFLYYPFILIADEYV